MNEDARRCYWEAIRYYHRNATSFSILRRVATAINGRERYDAMKRFFRIWRSA